MHSLTGVMPRSALLERDAQPERDRHGARDALLRAVPETGRVSRPCQVSFSGRFCATPAARKRRSGWRRTRHAKSPCSMRARGRSAWKATTMRWSSCATSTRAPCARTRCISTASAPGRPMTAGPHRRSTRGSTSGTRASSSVPAGSAIPSAPPYTLAPAEHPLGFGVDALWALSRRLQSGQEEWPDCLLLLGDQVYADETSEETRAFIRARRDTSRPPGEQVADFEEYARLYREAWSDPDIRWLLATVPSTMIFDDHDVHDDWNISAAWVRDMRATSWWDERITGAFMSYWIYQHIGNLAPPELAEEPLLAELIADDDGGPRLREFARAVDREPAASRFAFHRDFGRSRLVVIDSRAARVLAEGRRDMVDDEEWQWIAEHARGAYDHLIIASTLPVFMTPGDRRTRGLERGGLRRRLGPACRARRREAPARARSRALARVPALVQDHDRAAARARRGRRRARHDLVHRRRRPHGLRRGGRRSASGSRAASSRSSARRSGIPSQPRERRVVKLFSTRAAGVLCARARAQRGRPAARRRAGSSSRR